MMEPVGCFDTTTKTVGIGTDIARHSMVTGLASQKTCVELAPARNLHAGQESLAGAVLPVVSGHSSVWNKLTPQDMTRYTQRTPTLIARCTSLPLCNCLMVTLSAIWTSIGPHVPRPR